MLWRATVRRTVGAMQFTSSRVGEDRWLGNLERFWATTVPAVVCHVKTKWHPLTVNADYICNSLWCWSLVRRSHLNFQLRFKIFFIHNLFVIFEYRRGYFFSKDSFTNHFSLKGNPPLLITKGLLHLLMWSTLHPPKYVKDFQCWEMFFYTTMR